MKRFYGSFTVSNKLRVVTSPILTKLLVGATINTSTLATLQYQYRSHSDHKTGDRDKPVTTTWILPSGERKVIIGYEGQTLLEIAQEQELPMEGACAGSCACSTCHVILDEPLYKQLNEPTDEELDMLDLAFMETPTSRLGCQVKLSQQAWEGAVVKLPKATRNMAVDGYVATPH